MNAVGINVSKGKSMVAIMRSFGEIVFYIMTQLSTQTKLCIFYNPICFANRSELLPS